MESFSIQYLSNHLSWLIFLVLLHISIRRCQTATWVWFLVQTLVPTGTQAWQAALPSTSPSPPTWTSSTPTATSRKFKANTFYGKLILCSKLVEGHSILLQLFLPPASQIDPKGAQCAPPMSFYFFFSPSLNFFRCYIYIFFRFVEINFVFLAKTSFLDVIGNIQDIFL